ncbi:glutathione S-transferase N-terminal domain-containing protein [Sphingosinicella soli]|uniref:GST-like protein n=1 Tax=Sphingosinicella soli TaxID=333708 RepID=A0A7W7B204_9SPHN|nr:glutathione S-transferase N-terminal domain-containing protein [Sphingosinicella soli]MBB4631623.1 GST-like protein [Sphingosinicella soli]
MIDLHFVTSPNVTKVVIALEEMGLEYRLRPTDLSKGEHLDPANVSGAINGKLPVICDDSPEDGGDPITIFESGAILQYLAERSGRFLPAEGRARIETMQWLFWQMGGIGPIGGQLWHFRMFAPRIAPDVDNSYSCRRYDRMFDALWETMDRRLTDRAYLAADYSIADMAAFPWIAYLEPERGIASFPNVQRWRDEIAARPAVRAAYEKAGSVDAGYARAENGATMFPWEGLMENVIVV